MPPHSIGSGAISFGLVTIPVRMYSATQSGGISFNLLHAKCGNRIKYQQICPVDNEIVERSDIVKGYEFAKDQYVRFTPEELKAVEGEASRMIDIAEFVPLAKVDPIYFENTYYLGPDKGGEKAYRLLADAMKDTKRVAVAQFVMRGKENLVLIRELNGGLLLHTMYFADEVRDFSEIDKGQDVKIKSGEVDLAHKLIDELAKPEFKPEQYKDEYRDRLLKAVEEKVEGKEITAIGPEVQKTQVIDLMDALKQSLGRRMGEDSKGKSAAKQAKKLEKKPAAKAKTTKVAETPQKRAAGKR
jgi:DNA end-binding protein Ku